MEDVLTQKIGNYIKIFAITILLIILIYNGYENNRSNLQLKQSQKTADSLEALIEKYQYDYIELKKRSDELDSILNLKKNELTEVKGSFNKRRKTPPKTANESYVFVNKFLGE